MKAELRTSVEVHTISVAAELASLEERPELGLLCKKATGNGYLTAELIMATLPGITEPGARNILAHCIQLGLCGQDGNLTTLGKECAEEPYRVPVPEQGIYRLWLLDHPLSGKRAVHMERRTADTKAAGLDKIEPLPVVPPQNTTFPSLLDGKTFQFRKMITNHNDLGCLRELKKPVTLCWQIDFGSSYNSWTFSGKLEKSTAKSPSICHQQERAQVNYDTIISCWAGPSVLGKHGSWDHAGYRLLLNESRIDDEALSNFRISISCNDIEVPGFSGWQSAHIKDIPVAPADRKVAQVWAMRRLDLKLGQGYLSRNQVREQFVTLTEETPLAQYNPELPSHSQMLSRAKEAPELFWALAAPVDLAPHALSDAELDPLILDQCPQTRRLTGNSTVTIPHSHQLSMGDLISDLLRGMQPARILLCDRYVRGDKNLQILELLCQTIRQRSDASNLDIWTDKHEEDFARIEKITGKKPCLYETRFGKYKGNWPHDRYLLLETTDGERLAWQLSNSPLNAHPSPGMNPDTPLHWKDLFANLIQPEQLPPALAGWFAGSTR